MGIRRTAAALAAIVTIINAFPVLAKAYSDNERIVKFKSGYEELGKEYGLREINAKNGLYLSVNGIAEDGYASYAEYIEPNECAELIGGFSSVMRTAEEIGTDICGWQSMVHADSIWAFETYGNYVDVAVIDSGCSYHKDIASNIASGYNYLEESEDITDNKGHGTYVAGLIGAAETAEEAAGAAPKVNLHILKCSDAGVTTRVDTIVRAIYDAVDKYNCRVINISLGIKNDSEALREAVKYAYEKGAVIAAAAGNNGNGKILYPAGYDEVIGVGSVSNLKEVSSFSQRNSSVCVTAPGENICGLTGADGYTTLSGTSSSAAIVSGIAALLMSADEALDNRVFAELIKECSEDIGDSGPDESYGYGLINAERMFLKFLVNKECYVSPVNKNCVFIYNNSENNLSASVVVKKCGADGDLDISVSNICLRPNSGDRIEYSGREQQIKCFVWKSLDDITPLYNIREGGLLK